eukprot:TRINITY_DN6413_c0_g1_i1.p1 TRINITY_DN6413_c0_g1~~TRINITY_DN6413_c0_g1_i1.p1  ORF type:complete len:397 (+),score=10.78 TRINITY_DN6413_c0_g1_i1:47-1237(+)
MSKRKFEGAVAANVAAGEHNDAAATARGAQRSPEQEGETTRCERQFRDVCRRSVAPSTLKAYDGPFEDWCDYRMRNGKDIYLRPGPDRESQLDAVTALGGFMWSLFRPEPPAGAKYLNGRPRKANKEGTIASRLSAIAFRHKMDIGVELPTAHFLIKAGKKGFLRQQGEEGGNVAKARRGLSWTTLKQAKGTKSIWQQWQGGMVVWYGLAMSFVLLARASELWAYDSGAVHADYCIRRADLAFSKAGKPLPWSDRERSDAVTITFRASKSDQQRRGAQVTKECNALQLILEILRLQPALPMTAPLTAYMSQGVLRVVTRKVATSALRGMIAVFGDGANPMEYALHSGRIGAATALAAAGCSDSAIMAAGRWSSMSFLVYIRPSTEESSRVSDALVS